MDRHVAHAVARLRRLLLSRPLVVRVADMDHLSLQIHVSTRKHSQLTWAEVRVASHGIQLAPFQGNAGSREQGPGLRA
jgi:hypothetical protein